MVSGNATDINNYYNSNIIKQQHNLLGKLNFQSCVSGTPVLYCCMRVETFHGFRNFKMEQSISVGQIQQIKVGRF